MKMPIVTTQELKERAGEIVAEVRLLSECYVISQRGKEDVVLVPRWMFRSIEEQQEARMKELSEAKIAEPSAQKGDDSSDGVAEDRGSYRPKAAVQRTPQQRESIERFFAAAERLRSSIRDEDREELLLEFEQAIEDARMERKEDRAGEK